MAQDAPRHGKKPAGTTESGLCWSSAWLWRL